MEMEKVYSSAVFRNILLGSANNIINQLLYIDVVFIPFQEG